MGWAVFPRLEERSCTTVQLGYASGHALDATVLKKIDVLHYLIFDNFTSQVVNCLMRVHHDATILVGFKAHRLDASIDQAPLAKYPDRFEVRYVSANGGIRWNKRFVTVSQVCVGEYVGLEEIDDGVWNVYFGPLKLGRLLERHMRIEDAYGRLKRKNV
jgi:hypothetical protein